MDYTAHPTVLISMCFQNGSSIQIQIQTRLLANRESLSSMYMADDQ